MIGTPFAGRAGLRHFLIILVTCLTACQTNGKHLAVEERDLPESMTEFAATPSGKDRLTALYLLVHINLSPARIERVIEGCKVAEGDLDRLLCAYFIYGKTQSSSAARDFVSAFPSDRDGLKKLFGDSMTIEMPTDLIDLLHNLATTDSTALKKLIVASMAADGWVAESLNGALRQLNASNPDRISGARKDIGAGS